jgi:hypothetical protein
MLHCGNPMLRRGMVNPLIPFTFSLFVLQCGKAGRGGMACRGGARRPDARCRGAPS